MQSIINSFSVLADATRVRIMLLLLRGELSVAELQLAMGMGQSRISTNLSKLKQAGLVRDRRCGKSIFYGPAVDDGSMVWRHLREMIGECARQIPEAADDARALEMVHRKRKDRAREYFNRLAGKFGRNYCPGRTWRGLAHVLLAFFPRKVVADLGAGEGTLSQMIARHAERVIAVDNSERMVEFGQTMARENNVTNLEYRLGDIEDPPIGPSSVDIVLFSQALHHAVDPGRAVRAAHVILRPGGRIAILDLLRHTHEEAQELYADLWLGFSEQEIHAMLDRAGFRDIDVSVVSKDPRNPEFHTLLGTGGKPGGDPTV